MKDNKFIKFWRKFGPFFLFGTAITQVIMFNNLAVGSLFFILGTMLMTDND